MRRKRRNKNLIKSLQRKSRKGFFDEDGVEDEAITGSKNLVQMFKIVYKLGVVFFLLCFWLIVRKLPKKMYT